MSTFRTQVAEDWHECATLTRRSIFGPGDELRPIYQNSHLNWQIDVPSVGLVGKQYEPGGLVLLSVNPAGGKDDFVSDCLSDMVYERCRDLQRSGIVLQRFEASNKAFLASMPEWRFSQQRSSRVMEASGKSLNDISFLYLVPFRIRGDGGSSMSRSYFEKGYVCHLRSQLEILSPGHIIAMDRPSERAALTYKNESKSRTKVIYFTGQRNAHNQRSRTLIEIQREFR